MTRRYRWPGVLLLMLLAGACAISPQTVAVHPQINAAATNLGQGRRLALSVVDQRSRKLFGTLGGIYNDTATIGPSGDIIGPVRQAVAKVLTAEGFKVVPAGSGAALDMQIRIEDIDYQATGEPIVRKVVIGARVGVDAKRGNRTYSASSQVKETRDVLKVPTPAENETYINDAVSHVLQKLLADADLKTFVR